METTVLLFVAVSFSHVYFHLCLLLKVFVEVEASLWTSQSTALPDHLTGTRSLPKDSASLPSSGKSLQNSSFPVAFSP